ncbi:hypothetical protein CANINC_002060 [Pichia inconspicua]|uniref:Peptidase S54 rhomboid domain-containing protein n=1 Tax=Pichia inconspicua TaxID=52247 RepID=A0A4T0X3E4_9ASCO|nr:hypothetical protein CANINC_002060 [[Candida] inconspicua]
MTAQLPQGFRYLRLSEYIAIALIAIPFFISILDLKPYFLFAWDPFISRWNQYWRLILIQLQFQNQSEVALSSILVMIHLKGLERVFGSLRMAKILLLLWMYNLITITIISLATNQIGFNLFVPSGPFGILFALYYPYEKYIPKTYLIVFDFRSSTRYKPLGEDIIIHISDKFTAQLMYLLLMLNEGFCSFVVSLSGYFIGYLYFNGLIPIGDESLGFVDRLYYHFKHKAVPRITLLSATDTTASIVDDEEEDDNVASREETPVPPRTIGQQMMDTFT